MPIRRSGPVGIEIPKAALEKLYLQQKLLLDKCAEHFNCTRMTILRRLRKYGVPRRSTGEVIKGRSSPMKGRHHTKGTKLQISKSLKGRKLAREHVRKALRKRIPSMLEKKFEKIIDGHNLPYVYVGDGSFKVGTYNPDFININGKKIAIEVYTRFYKQIDDRNIEDWKEERTEVFRSYGWEIIYFDETEVNEKKVLEVLGGIEN